MPIRVFLFSFPILGNCIMMNTDNKDIIFSKENLLVDDDVMSLYTGVD